MLCTYRTCEGEKGDGRAAGDDCQEEKEEGNKKKEEGKREREGNDRQVGG